jgi:hypothetical protein
MKKLRLFTWASMLLIAVSSLAQDAIHGVDGYYNWTAKRLQSENILLVGGTGTVLASAKYGYTAKVVYTADGYAKYYMNANDTSATPLFKFRTDWKTKFTKTTPLTITKKYPVIAIKIGVPDSAVAYNSQMTKFYLEWLYNGDSTSVAGTTLPTYGVAGTYSNCRTDAGTPVTSLYYYADTAFYYAADKVTKIKKTTMANCLGYGGMTAGSATASPYLSNTFKTSWSYKDSLYTWTATGPKWIKTGHKYTYSYNDRFAIGDSVTKVTSSASSQTQSTTMGYFHTDDAITSDIIYIDLSAVFKKDSTKFHINRDLQITNLTAVMESFMASKFKKVNTYDEAGNLTGTQNVLKTAEETPSYLIKWIKTFPSVKELRKATAVNAGDGNDTRSDNQISLNSVLYYAQKMLNNYAYTEPANLAALQSAFDSGLTVYQSTAPSTDKTSAEWLIWDATVAKAVTDLTAAKTTFLKSITANLTNPYNVIKTGNGAAELMIGAVKTVNGISGKLLTFGGQGSGTPFVMVKSASTINGQTAYTLSNSTGRVCVVKDTLLLVPTAKLASATTALFVFSNRSVNDYPSFDVYVNGKFLYLDPTTNKMSYVTAIPDGEISTLGSYLYDITPATYDATADDPSITTFAGWEFENSSVEGWKTIPYKPFGNISNEVIDTKGTLKIDVSPTYYAGIDTLKTTLLNTDFSVAGGIVTLSGREGGKYPNSAKLEPTVRDSSFIIWTNAYKNRYLAVKYAANDTIVKLTQLSLFAVKTIDEVLLTPANMLGKKGDVMYWDLLALGVPYGNKGWSCQYMNVSGFTNTNQKAYIDWVRPYNSTSDIPNEILNVLSAVYTPSADGNVRIRVQDRKIIVNTEKASSITVYNVSGMKVASKFESDAVLTVNNKGVYIVIVNDNNRQITSKVIVD